MVECSFIYSKFHDGFVSDRWGLVSVLFDCKKELNQYGSFKDKPW